MKLNKQILKQIIKEELENFSEADKYTRSATRRNAVGDAKEKMVGGITDDERKIIATLSSKLAKAAAKTNIGSGVIGDKIEQLSAVLDKAIGITVDDLRNAALTAKEQPGGNK